MCCVGDQRDLIVSGSTVSTLLGSHWPQPKPFALKISWEDAEAGRLSSRVKDKTGGTPVVKDW